MTLELWLNVKSSNCRQIKRRCAAPELRPLFNQLVALCQKTLNKKITSIKTKVEILLLANR